MRPITSFEGNQDQNDPNYDTDKVDTTIFEHLKPRMQIKHVRNLPRPGESLKADGQVIEQVILFTLYSSPSVIRIIK
jgi:hypothetical protein